MNSQHLRAFVWLRWRLFANQLKRGGTVSAVLLLIVGVLLALSAVGLFVGLFFVGFLAMRKASPAIVLYVWDGAVLGFLFFWMIGLLNELQRSEVLSLTKFLHLPVSPTGVFLINYLSSLFNFCLIMIVPPMIGLAGLVLAQGPTMLLLLPLLAALLLMVTALTYQFQGWLATLMVNPRRRRTVMVFMTAAFILVAQLPNLVVNVMQPWKFEQQEDLSARYAARLRELGQLVTEKKITVDEFQKRQAEMLEEQQLRMQESNQQSLQQLERTTRLISLCLPPGWVGLGAAAAAERNVLPALLGTLGLTLIGALSLWRSYRTTLRLYTGQFVSKTRRFPAPQPASRVQPVGSAVRTKGEHRGPHSGPYRTALLERNLPWISEQATAVALAGFRSLLRAPEAKMLLLTPVIMLLIFGSLAFTHSMSIPGPARPLLPFGAMAMLLLTTVQLAGNQFGYDRGGFRVFVLCAAPRKDILLGKNLAFAPVPLGLGLLMLLLIQVLFPMRVDHLIAALPQFVSMYAIFCLMTNLLSIVAPMPIAAGSIQPKNVKLIPILLQMVFVIVFPLAMLPIMLPIGVEFLLGEFVGLKGVPTSLALSLIECVVLAYLYRLVLRWQGALLQAREQELLQIVAARAE